MKEPTLIRNQNLRPQMNHEWPKARLWGVARTAEAVLATHRALVRKGLAEGEETRHFEKTTTKGQYGRMEYIRFEVRGRSCIDTEEVSILIDSRMLVYSGTEDVLRASSRGGYYPDCMKHYHGILHAELYGEGAET